MLYTERLKDQNYCYLLVKTDGIGNGNLIFRASTTFDSGRTPV